MLCAIGLGHIEESPMKDHCKAGKLKELTSGDTELHHPGTPSGCATHQLTTRLIQSY
jgi:hypothetical protein